ncbi:MAG: helix-turn-helix domain-containing protein [Bacteroidota bacterium]
MSRLFKTILLHITSFLAKKKGEDSMPASLKISDAIILQVMDELSDFENHQGYLKPITLHSLAKKLKTNPKYLSKIINNHYQKNFSSYINDLRINYLLKELTKNDTLQKCTIKSLAKKLGFGNPESFAKAFKRHTGVNPSTYINELK